MNSYNIINHLKKNKDIYLLNYLSIIIYIIVFIVLKIKVSESLMFGTVTDSWTYLSASNEFYKFSEVGYSNIRPFLYPLVILVVNQIFGAIGLWILQVLFWIISINLVFLSIKRVTQNRALSFVGSLIIAMNSSYIVLTFSALTETTTIFLVSLLIYFMSFNVLKLNTLKFFHGCLLILVLLACVKPLFYSIVIFMLIIILPFFYFKKYMQTPKSLIYLALITIPLAYQLTMMKVKYNTFSFSPVVTSLLNNYFLPQGVQQSENISWEAAHMKTKNLSTSEELHYLLENKMVYTGLYFRNMKLNVKAIPWFVLFHKGSHFSEIKEYQIFVNSVCYYIHIIFIIPILISLYFVYKRKEMNSYFFLMIVPWFLLYYIFLTIPLSLWEGDRYVVICLPIWVFLYSLILNFMFKKNGLFKSINLICKT
ncbi:MAG: hypothetical protein Q8L90_02705 [Bacteroidota bacterium]|nr:hypothetical protein [Bacteroidota bacterium]